MSTPASWRANADANRRTDSLLHDQAELNPKRSSPCGPAGRGRLAAGCGRETGGAFDAAGRSASGSRGTKTVCRPPRPSAPLRMNAPPSESTDAAGSPRRYDAGAALRPAPMPPSDENTRGGTGAGGGGGGGLGGAKRAACDCGGHAARATEPDAAARASAAVARTSAAPADATVRASSSRTLAFSAFPRATARLKARITSSAAAAPPPACVCRRAETAAA